MDMHMGPQHAGQVAVKSVPSYPTTANDRSLFSSSSLYPARCVSCRLTNLAPQHHDIVQIRHALRHHYSVPALAPLPSYYGSSNHSTCQPFDLRTVHQQPVPPPCRTSQSHARVPHHRMQPHHLQQTTCCCPTVLPSGTLVMQSSHRPRLPLGAPSGRSAPSTVLATTTSSKAQSHAIRLPQPHSLLGPAARPGRPGPAARRKAVV